MLSDKAIQALRPDPDRPGTKHHDRDGLYLWVARSGSKTWRKDYRWQGSRRTFTIGTYPATRLADARKLALELNTWIKTGIDPLAKALGLEDQPHPIPLEPAHRLRHRCGPPWSCRAWRSHGPPSPASPWADPGGRCRRGSAPSLQW